MASGCGMGDGMVSRMALLSRTTLDTRHAGSLRALIDQKGYDKNTQRPVQPTWKTR